MSVFVIAEAGSNWYAGPDETDGERFGRALELVRVAAEAGADAVKFQAFRADDLYARDTDHWRTVKPLELALEWLRPLYMASETRGLEFMCSAFSEAMVDAVDPYVKRHKVASLEGSDLSLIRHVISKGKPMLVSTGSWDSRQMLMTRYHSEMFYGGYPSYELKVPSVTFLHCTTAYPCPPEEANLNVLYFDDEMGRSCDGFSDHTLDPVVAPVMAVALGATVIEKHFTLSRSLNGPDHAYALEPAELKEMVRCVRLAEKMLGDGLKRVMPSEEKWRAWQHRDGGLRGA